MVRGMVAAILAFASIVAACGAEEDPSPIVVQVASEANPRDPHGGCMMALASGVLVADQRSGIALNAGDRIVTVVWPFGFSGRVVDGRLALVDDRGVITAWVGDRVEMGGGFLPPNETFHSCGAPTVVR